MRIVCVLLFYCSAVVTGAGIKPRVESVSYSPHIGLLYEQEIVLLNRPMHPLQGGRGWYANLGGYGKGGVK